jgi:hypothetical protein
LATNARFLATNLAKTPGFSGPFHRSTPGESINWAENNSGSRRRRRSQTPIFNDLSAALSYSTAAVLSSILVQRSE